ARAQARRGTQRRAPAGGARGAEDATREDGDLLRVPGSEARRVAQRERARSRGEAALHGRRHRRREGSRRPLRRHARAPAGRGEAMNWDALDAGILGPALVAGLLVLATHVALGVRVLDKGIVFIDLAIAQIAGLGVIAADALGLPEGGV